MNGDKNQESQGPTRDADDSRITYLSQVDQHVAAIAEALKGAKGYQLTFTTIYPDKKPMNHAIRNSFPNDISLAVHKECRDELVKQHGFAAYDYHE